MAGVEKLFVQIFDRKNWIIEQVNQRTELYNQHLASKLLIDGITPPSWLWSPNAVSESKELNKEELISKLLRAYPQPSIRSSVAHCPLYSNPVVITGDNEEFSDGVFMENLEFNKGLNRQDDPTVLATNTEDHAGYATVHVGCVLDTVPEPDPSVTSPEDQTEERILNIYNGSLAGIQRSKSRQKVLELRSSGKELAKSCLNHENITDGFSSQIRFSLSAANQAGQITELSKLAESCVIGTGCEGRGLNEAGCRKKEKGMDMSFGRVTRSRSNAHIPDFVRDSLTSGCSSEDCKEDASSNVAKVRKFGSLSISNSDQADNYVNELPKSAGEFSVFCQSCGDRRSDGEDGLRKGSETGVYTGRTTRSKVSSRHGSCACDSSKPDAVDDCQRIEICIMDSGDDLPPDCLGRSLATVSPANVLNEVCEARESISEDCKSQWKKSDVASSSSSKHNACVDELFDMDIPSHSARVGGSIAPSHGRSAPQANGSNEIQGLVKPSTGLSRRVTRSQTRSDDKEISEPVKGSEYHSLVGIFSKSGSKQKPAANSELQNASGSQLIISCYGTHDMLDEHGNSSYVMATEHVLHDHVDQSGGIAPSHGRSAPQANGSNEIQGLVKPSTGLSRRVTRSQTRSDDKEISEPVKGSEYHSLVGIFSKSGSKQKPAANSELQNASGSQLIISCYGTHDMLDEHGNSSYVMATEHVLHDHVDQSGSSSSSDDMPIELESQAALVPSDSLFLVEPRELNFNETEEDNLRTSTLTSGNRRLNKSQIIKSFSLSNPAVSLDKGIFGDTDLSLGKQSPEKSDSSSKKEEVPKDSIEPAVQQNPNNQADKCEPVICKNTVLTNFEDDTEAGLNCKSSEIQDAYLMQSEMINIPEKCEPVIWKNTMLTNFEDDTEAGLNCKSSEIQDAYLMQSEMISTPDDAHVHPVKFSSGNAHELLTEPHIKEVPELQIEEGDWSGEGKDSNQLVTDAPEIKNMRLSHCPNSINEPTPEMRDCLIESVEMTNPTSFDLDKIQQFPVQESQMSSFLEGEVSGQHSDSPLGDIGTTCSTVSSLHGENFSLERRSRIASMESWQQLKRRKIEHEQLHSFTVSPRFRARKPHSTQKTPGSIYLESMKINADTVVMDTFDSNKSTDMEIHQETDPNLQEGTGFPFSDQNGEVGFCYKEKNEQISLSCGSNNEHLGEALVSSLPNTEAKGSHGCFPEEKRTPNSSSKFLDTREPDDSQCNQHLRNVEKHTDNLNSENLTLTNTALQEMQSSKKEVGSQTQRCPNNKDLELIDVDQSMPVFEGFTVDAEADTGELDFTADGIDFDRLDLPRTTIERASILAEICRSASLDTPLSDFSSTFEFQRTQTLFHPLPNGLESLDLRSRTLSSNSHVGKELQSGKSLADDYNNTFDGMPYTDFLTYSGTRFGWNSRNQQTSPVGKLWERLSLHSGSSEKHLSSNPELTCFPIEEDPSVSKENKTAEDNADDVEEEISSSLAKQSDQRKPLKDLTNSGMNNPLSVSVQEQTWMADSLEFVSTKFSMAGTHDMVQWSLKDQCREKYASSFGASDGRRNQTLSLGTNGIKKAKESINNGISKPVLKKTSLKRQDQKLSLNESRRNNIVSNVSSFIPLVQQKQAAAVCAENRDVKVKALKAAGAAKRLEEKRENDRKMRKEAMELERAKLEEENLRNMELERKKKEEDRKKKDADIIAKKRLREEEERKDKEKKRMRLETRQQKRGQEEKMRADKAGKQKQRPKEVQINSKKELHIESKKQQNTGTIRVDEVALQKAETKSTPTAVVINNEECRTSGQCFEVGKAMRTEDKSPKNEDLIVQKNPGKSYEISPYQCSDDEDEEDDELPTKKFVPSWASKSCVALLLPLQQRMVADKIFPPESFCNMDEVLLPRKLQQKQVAT